MKTNHCICIGLTACAVLLLPSAPTFAADADKPTLDRAVMDALGGAPAKRDYVFSLQGGWAFSALRVQAGLTNRLALVTELESVLLLRNRPMIGVGMRWVDRPRLRITGEALGGWLFQNSEEIRRGPNAELRVRVAVPLRRFVPYAVLSTRHALLPDLTTIERASETETSWSFRHEWTPWATIGLGFAITSSIGVDLAINYGWVDAPNTIALPGFHVGLHFGGGR